MQFAAKRLTRSDLTLFEEQFRRQNAGNQKSINLNRRVFVDLMFPGAPARAGGRAVKFPVVLRIFGPDGIADVHQVTRKIIAAGDRQKNWRLNGETIHDPDDGSRPGRYDDLQEGDYVVLGLEGGDVPDAIDMVVLSQAGTRDVAILAELSRLLGTRVMATLTEGDLEALATVAPAGHPIAELVDPQVDEDLEEAALGSVEAVRRLRRRTIRRQSAEDLAAARARAEKSGRDGEVLVAGHMRAREAGGRISDFVWESEANAIHPWDMTYRTASGEERRAEIKSTTGPHSRPFHVSQAEIEVAAEAGAPRTEVWRVSELDDDGGVLRRSRNFRTLADRIVTACAGLGAGMTPDGWTINPDLLSWSDPRTLSFEEDPDA